MAATFTPWVAIEDSMIRVKKLPMEELSMGIVNEIFQKIWNAANWGWSISSFEAVINNTNPAQSFTTGKKVDFGRAIQGVLVIPTKGANNQVRSDTNRYIDPVSFIPTTTLTGLPTRFQYIQGETMDTIKFDVQTQQEKAKFIGFYKKTIPVIGKKDMHTAGIMGIPDEWYHVFKEGVLWKTFQYADDDRAGNVVINDGRLQYSGQCAIFFDALSDMVSKEPKLFLGSKNVGEKVE